MHVNMYVVLSSTHRSLLWDPSYRGNRTQNSPRLARCRTQGRQVPRLTTQKHGPEILSPRPKSYLGSPFRHDWTPFAAGAVCVTTSGSPKILALGRTKLGLSKVKARSRRRTRGLGFQKQTLASICLHGRLCIAEVTRSSNML